MDFWSNPITKTSSIFFLNDDQMFGSFHEEDSGIIGNYREGLMFKILQLCRKNIKVFCTNLIAINRGLVRVNGT